MPTTSKEQAAQLAVEAAKKAAELANARMQNEMASAYFEDIAPAQASAQRQLNDLGLQQQQNEVDRGLQREQQYRQIASKYASRGMRGPTQATEVNNYEKDLTRSRADEARAMNTANANYQEKFGTGQNAQNFFDNPTVYGTVGTAARRAALARLQAQGVNYTNVGA